MLHHEVRNFGLKLKMREMTRMKVEATRQAEEGAAFSQPQP
jgi:hypothetical protein